MYPDHIGPEVLIENSDIPNKEAILQQVKPPVETAPSGKPQAASPGKKLKFSKDFVNVVS
jgi:hypothetical protein